MSVFDEGCEVQRWLLWGKQSYKGSKKLQCCCLQVIRLLLYNSNCPGWPNTWDLIHLIPCKRLLLFS